MSDEECESYENSVGLIEYKERDITTVTRGVIAHGVNCQRAMGSGVAKALYTKWPEIRESYMEYAAGPQHLGQVDFVDVTHSLPPEESIIVANCWTQEHYGNDGKVYADIEAVRKCLENVYHFADTYELPVILPKIGCGLAGLDWEKDVEPIVEALDEELPRVPTTVCIWPPESE